MIVAIYYSHSERRFMKKILSLILASIITLCAPSLYADLETLDQESQTEQESERFVIVIEARVDNAGQPIDLKNILATCKVDNQIDLEKILKCISYNPYELTTSNALNNMARGLFEISRGMCIIVIVTGQYATPFVVDLVNNKLIPFSKKHFAAGVEMSSQTPCLLN